MATLVSESCETMTIQSFFSDKFYQGQAAMSGELSEVLVDIPLHALIPWDDRCFGENSHGRNEQSMLFFVQKLFF